MPKNEKFEENLEIPEIWTFYGTRAKLSATQNRFATENSPSHNVRLRNVVQMNNSYVFNSVLTVDGQLIGAIGFCDGCY